MIKKLAIKTINCIKFYRSEPDFLKKLKTIKDTSKKLLLIGTPIHGNLGDHLIAEAEKQYLTSHFKDYKYIECTMPFSRYFLKNIIQCINEQDLVFISGGGWLGSEWKHNEDFVRILVRNISKCPVVVLPQTVFYKSFDEYAQLGKAIYTDNPNLLFCVREKKSFDFLMEHYFNGNASDVLLMPDFALFYSSKIQHQRSNHQKIKICFRDDREKSMSIDDRDSVLKTIRSFESNPVNVTTNTDGLLIKPRDRNKEIQTIIAEIADSKLLITDRLHAMIMAAISGTPCIAFDNSTHKVGGVYSWISHLNYVRLCQPGDDITAIVRELLALERVNIYNPHIYDGYLTLLTKKIMTMEENLDA